MRKLLQFSVLILSFIPVLVHAQIDTRWYSYGQYLNNITTTGNGLLNIWNDTTDVLGDMSTGVPAYYTNAFTSVGMSFAPVLDAWNDVSLYGATISVGPSDPYTIDSIRIYGSYMRNPAKPVPVDTLVISFVYGNGSVATNLPDYYFTSLYAEYGYDTIYFLGMAYDSITDIATGYAGVAATPYVQTILLKSTDTATVFEQTYALSTPFPVPAGNCASMSITFKSGDASYTPFDTVEYASGTYKYGDFLSLLAYNGTTGFPEYAIYNPLDSNVGYFEMVGAAESAEGWGGIYIPTWAWTGSGGITASQLQYPLVDFHIICPTCEFTDTISGTTTVCFGDTATLYYDVSGGTWSSSNTAIASINPTTGLATGIAAGTATITYTYAGGYSTTTFTVDTYPVVTALSGPTTVCVSAYINISDIPSGGNWSGTGAASVNPVTGAVTGLYAGTATVSYSITNACGTSDMLLTIVTVYALPSVSNIIGSDSVCIGDTTTLSDTTASGVWSAVNGNASISAGGAVIGLTAGTDIISYSVTNTCGTTPAELSMNIIDCTAGIINIPGITNGITLYPNPTQNTITITAATTIHKIVINNSIGQQLFSGNYNNKKVMVSLEQFPVGIYLIKINDSKVYKVTRQ